MNYFLTYLGKEPSYIKYCLNTILSVDEEAKIYFCSDFTSSYSGVTHLAASEISSDLTKEVNSINIYKNTNYDQNPLWNTSLLRIFYLLDMCNELRIDSFIHFDLDVIIYKPFSILQKYMVKNKLNITPLNEYELIFGYSYSDNFSNYSKITNAVFKNIEIEASNSNEPLNEMKMLAKVHNYKPELFNLLPHLPSEEGDFIFDPASYGQYIGGLDGKPRRLFSKPWAGDHHYVGSLILKKEISVKFKNQQPFAEMNNKRFDLANLHIHSKNLKKFLPKEYKAFN